MLLKFLPAKLLAFEIQVLEFQDKNQGKIIQVIKIQVVEIQGNICGTPEEQTSADVIELVLGQ